MQELWKSVPGRVSGPSEGAGSAWPDLWELPVLWRERAGSHLRGHPEQAARVHQRGGQAEAERGHQVFGPHGDKGQEAAHRHRLQACWCVMVLLELSDIFQCREIQKRDQWTVRTKTVRVWNCGRAKQDIWLFYFRGTWWGTNVLE